MSDVCIRSLGRCQYLPVYEAMQTFTAQRDDSQQDEIWWLEHEPVFTQGRAGKAEYLLNPGDIPVVDIDRGGQVTYHGPGQITVYVMVNLKRRQLGVRDLVTVLENAIIKTLQDYGIAAVARKDAPGVYVNGAKIASLGLRISRGCSYHGLALNVDTDNEPWSRINPCGLSIPMSNLNALVGEPQTLNQVANTLIDNLCAALGYNDVFFDPIMPKVLCRHV